MLAASIRHPVHVVQAALAFRESAIDLRYLNDDVAGDRGFLQRYGEHFLFAVLPLSVTTSPLGWR